MPIMGPDDAREEADKFFDEVLELLSKKPYFFNKPASFYFFQEEYLKGQEKVREGLREMFKAESYESW